MENIQLTFKAPEGLSLLELLAFFRSKLESGEYVATELRGITHYYTFHWDEEKL